MNTAQKMTPNVQKRILEFNLEGELNHGKIVSNLAYEVAKELGLPGEQIPSTGYIHIQS